MHKNGIPMRSTGKFKKKNVIKFAVFLILVAAVSFVCISTLGFADAQMSEHALEDFYELDENTVDCVFFGSSVVQRGEVVPKAWKDYGIASYSMATPTQPFVLTRYLMEEVQKTQSPKLFVVELKSICKGPDKLNDVSVRRVVDNMKPSMTRYRAIRDVTRYAEGADNTVDTTGWSYYFPFLKYHSRWNPSLQPETIEYIDYYNGYSMDEAICFMVNGIHSMKSTDQMEPIDKENERVLGELLDYCDGLEADVLFMISPYEATVHGAGKLNYAKEIIEGRGYECISFLPEEARKKVGLDDRTCYYNREHLNYYGAAKLTDYMSRYIMNRYGIEDRREDVKYAAYNDLYDRFDENMNGKYAEYYTEMMKEIKRLEDNNQ